MSSDLWNEKRIHRGEVISAWLVVLIEVVIVLLIFGISGPNCCDPSHARVNNTVSSGSSHELVPQESALTLHMLWGTVRNSCVCFPGDANEIQRKRPL